MLKRGKKLFKRRVVIVGMIVLATLLSALCILLALQLGVFTNPFQNYHFFAQQYTVEDKCSFIVGQLIHTYNDEGSCQLQCRSQCESRDERYVNAEFTKSLTGCHSCDCFCK